MNAHIKTSFFYGFNAGRRNVAILKFYPVCFFFTFCHVLSNVLHCLQITASKYYEFFYFPLILWQKVLFCLSYVSPFFNDVKKII